MSELMINREGLDTVFANFAPQMFDFCDCNGAREICDQYSRCTDCVKANLNVLHYSAEEKLQAEVGRLKRLVKKAYHEGRFDKGCGCGEWKESDALEALAEQEDGSEHSR